jgi:NAD(P)-dependent dehydrogenase (short-subunit alcohol dehydrogenase family)
MTEPTTPSGGLEGQSMLITGGGSGIGLGCARWFAADGANVTICGRTEEKLTAAVEEIRGVGATGIQVQHVVCDVTDEDQVAEAVDVAAAPTGVVDGVVASAGGSAGLWPISQIPVEDFRSVMELNVTGTFLTLKHWSRLMASAGHGSFVGMSSIAAPRSHRWFGPYGVAKAAIDALVELAADELGPSGIRVNSIRPGLTDTELVGFVTAGGDVLENYQQNMPLRRVGTVEDIAGLARFLIGPDSTWITGQAISADGGHHLRAGPDYSSLIEPLYGADGLRGVVDS